MTLKFEALRKVAEVNFKYRKFGNLSKISKIDTISPPSVFIGSKLRYPLVNVGILSPLDKIKEAWIYDDAKYWAKNDFEIKDVLGLRNSLLNSRFQSKVQDSRLNKRFVEIAKEVAIASKPVDVEIELKNKVNLGKHSDSEKILTPHGMRGNLKNAKIISNVKIHRQLDKAMNDEIKANQGIEILYQRNFDEYSLSKILSVGVLGLKKNKKLVPTRWSITATDDTITKNILKKIRDYKEIENFELFFGEFLGNQYVILLFPDIWSFELFELYAPGTSWNPTIEFKASTDYESFAGRKTYASNTGGGYYATRLPIAEYLNKIKRQASVIVIRIETSSYWAALGVWVVRESVRKALNNESMHFPSKEELIEGAKQIGKIKYDFDYTDILSQSKLLKEKSEQKTLRDFL